jgi:hypothetical protein
MSGNNYEPNSIDATLSRIEQNQITIMAGQSRFENALIEQNRRLNILEVAENKRVGAIAAIGLVCSFIGGIFVLVIDFFKGK